MTIGLRNPYAGCLGAVLLALGLAGCDQVPGNSQTPQMPCGGSTANCAPPPAGAADGWSRHTVVDRNGFDRPMEAFTVAVPPGWRIASQIRWDGVNGQCSIGIASGNIRMTSPDGGQQIDFMPGFLVSSDSDPIVRKGARPGDYCVVASVNSGERLMREIAIPRLRPGWTIESLTSVAMPPELDRNLQQMRQIGGPGRIDGYALEAILTNPNNPLVEKFFMAGVVSELPPVIAEMGPSVLNQNMRLWSVRGPREQLPALSQLVEQLRTSVQINPEWKRLIDDHVAKVTKPDPPRRSGYSGGSGGGSGGGSTSGGGFDMDKWREDQRRDDREQHRRVDRVYEREVCVDPDTGERYYVPESVGCR